MARMRVHELAKELKMTTKELMEKMIEMGIPVKNHMSMVSDSDVAYLKRHFKKEVRKTRVINKKVEPTKIIRRRRARKDEPKPESLEPSEVSEGLEKSGEVVQVEAEPEQDVQEVMAEKSKPEAAEPEVVEEKTPEEEEEIQVPPKDGTEPIAVQETEAAREEKKEEKIEEEESTDGKSEVAMEPPLEESEQEGIAEEVPVVEEPEEAEKTAEEKAKPEVKGPEEPVTAVQNEVMAPEKEKAKEERGKKEEKRSKARRSRRRRKKRSHKVEAAKIIQLPEFIPETEEEARDEDLESKVRVKLDEAPVKKAAKGGKKFKARSEKDEERGEKEIPPRVGKEKRVKGKKAEAEVEEKKVVEAKEEIPKESEPAPSPTAPPKPSKRKIRVEEAIVVGDLAKQMGIKANEVIKKLLLLGLPVTVNQSIDFDTAALVASEFGFEVEKKGFEEEDILHTAEDKPEDLQPRPPVVTVMGHVDHGKTSLLDAIRHTNVTAREAGGITQHIGAYHVTLDKGSIVFLDTPGHEAFTAMRARGARVTDIVILVVAADDGVMEQTVEAINHAKAADVPIIVAINKIDKPNANPERVKRELAEYGLVPEEWGGDTIMVEVSAKKNVGIDELLEMVLLQAELMELKANPNKPARGRVIEAKLEKGRGPVATVLIQEGTIHVGDAYVCGLHYGKVRNLFDDRGRRVSEAGPSMPVEVIGISGVPQAGDDFVVVADEKQAKLVAEHRQRKQREKELSKATKVTLEKLYEQMREGELKELNIVLKADVQGSLEALSTAISRLRHPEIKINVIHAATGSINETDVMLASASNAIVIGFNVRPDAKVEELAKKEHVDVRFYDVIYQVISDIKDAMAGLLEPEYREKILGRAEVRQTFHISKVGTVAGCYVLDGVVMRNAQVRVLRDQVVIYDSKIASLKRFKDDVKEVKAGFECGILVANFNDVKVGDVLEVYTVEEVRPSIDGVMEEQDEKDSTENGNQK
ncbi:MAG: translation initiation factor IF-2 [Deltaproteobacteria bacterium]|nr:translation initiation factor IF-2 [Deltaproteobacteria bacterium]MBW2068372.1 translation initiation factor IF-2 [Deltaproteobacteria bacterium]